MPPTFGDESSALVGRFIVIVMIETFFGNEDPALTSDLMAELAGILNWALVGYERLRERGHFIQPESSAEVIDEMDVLAAPTKAFVNAVCVIGANEEVDGDELWSHWESWRENSGGRAVSRNWFGRNLRTAVPGLRQVRGRDGDERKRRYIGIGIKKDEPM